MKQKKFQNEQIKLRNKFIKSGVKMTAPETVFFSKNTKYKPNKLEVTKPLRKITEYNELSSPIFFTTSLT